MKSSFFNSPVNQGKITTNFEKLQLESRQKILNLAQECKCRVFQLYKENSELNGQIYIVPNATFLEKIKSLNIVNFTLVSLLEASSGSGGRLPWDKDQEYGKIWDKDQWVRNWHLWVMLGEIIYNFALVRVGTFAYPKHLHADSWQYRAIKAGEEFTWMNLMISSLCAFPKEYLEVLNDIYDAMQNGTFTKIKQAGEYSAKTEEWNELLQFSLENHRKATYDHLVKHDNILDKPQNYQADKSLDAPKFKVTTSIEESTNLEFANCLCLFFLLGEPKFIANVAKTFGKDHAKKLTEIVTFLGIYNLDKQAYSQKYMSAYTSAQMLQQSIGTGTCKVALLMGAFPTQQITDTKNFSTKIPWKKLGFSDKFVAVVENPDNVKQIYAEEKEEHSSDVKLI